MDEKDTRDTSQDGTTLVSPPQAHIKDDSRQDIVPNEHQIGESQQYQNTNSPVPNNTQTDGNIPLPPSYLNAEDDAIATTSPNTWPFDPESLEEGRAWAIRQLGTERPPPTYAHRPGILPTSSLGTIQTSLQNVSRCKAPSESPYYVPRNPVQPGYPRPRGNSSSSSPSYIFSEDVFDGCINPHNRFSSKQKDLFAAFFIAIACGANDLVTDLLNSQLVDANILNNAYRLDNKNYVFTPLHAAVKSKRWDTARLLLEHGAAVNAWGSIETQTLTSLTGNKRKYHIMRTPLQLAASNGDLPMAKLLMEDFHADDSLVAPTDGQTALRLAAKAKHRNVVAYLPTRRGGAKQRWLTRWRHTSQDMHVAYSSIAHVVKIAVVKIPKWIGECMWEVIKALPRILRRILRHLPKIIATIPECLYELLKYLGGCTFRAVKAIPKVCKEILEFCWKTICKLSSALWRVLNRMFSFLHVAVVAVLTFFWDLTWANLCQSLGEWLYALFVTLPRAIWHAIPNGFELLLKLPEMLFGTIGLVLAFLVALVWCVIEKPLRKTGAVFVALGRNLGHFFEELFIWWNPKRV